MLRFSLGLITITLTLISCSSHHDQPGQAAAPPDAAPPDAAPTGPFTVTVVMNSLGVAMSDPPGIVCGKCSDAGSGVPCPLPDPNQAATDCSHAFDAGTTVSFGIGGQEVYDGDFCEFPANTGQPKPCTFVVTQDTTVSVTGFTGAFR